MEMEIKAKVSDFDGIKDILRDIGAEYTGKKEQRDIYFNHPCRDFAETDEAVRVRIEDHAYITYKGPKIDEKTKSREEVELRVEDEKKAAEFLKKLGFRKAGEVKKIRETYSYHNIEISLDTVEGLGLFVEIEIQGSEKDVEKLFEMGEKLGLEEYVRDSYLELLLKLKN